MKKVRAAAIVGLLVCLLILVFWPSTNNEVHVIETGFKDSSEIYITNRYSTVTTELSMITESSTEENVHEADLPDKDLLLTAPKRGFGRHGSQLYESEEVTDDASIEKSMNNRKQLLRERCTQATTNYTRYNDYNYFFSHNERHIYMCGLPKVSVSVWQTLMMSLGGLLNHTLYIPKLYDGRTGINGVELIGNRERKRQGLAAFERYQRYTKRAMKVVMERLPGEWFSWTVVRHPFERLVSCYRNKILEQPHKKFWLNILKFRGDNPEEYQWMGQRLAVSFSEFIDMVIWALTVKPHMTDDPHILPHSVVCAPCNFDFDYIIKYEHVDYESNFVLKKGGLFDEIQFPISSGSKSNSTNNAPSTVNLMQEYFSQLNKTQIYKLYRIYEDDFKLHGYV